MGITKVMGDFLAGIIVIAVIFTLVRPGSQGPTLVTSIGGALQGLVNAATGGGGWAAGSGSTPTTAGG